MTSQEKIITQTSSISVDEEQLSEKRTTAIIPEKKLTFNGNVIKPLEAIDGKSLLAKELPPIHFIIEKILPQGLFILAGSPKVGKSWLSLDFCQTVAIGGQIWDLNSNKGTVLYLALEDSLVRLQTRLKKITSEGEPNLFFSVRALKIQDGLVVQIADFIKEHPDTSLIVIDTMQHVRNNANDRNAYVTDYNDMNILRQITNSFMVSLILVTHTRKLDDPDPLNIISGSTGLVGAVDGVFILEKDTRTGVGGKLTIANRDTEGHVFILEFDNEKCRWRCIEEEMENVTEEPLLVFITGLIEDKNFWSGTATELCEQFSEKHTTKCVPATITKKLKSLEKVLKDDYEIKYFLKTEKNKRLIKIYREKE